MKAKFLRLFSILTLCGLFFGFSACQMESGDDDSSSKKTEETKTDDTQTGGQNTQTGKYKITYNLRYEEIDKNTVPSTSTYKTIYFDEPYTITEDDLAIPEPKSYMTGEEWVFDGWRKYSRKLTPGEIIDTSITVSGFWRTRYSRNLSYYSQYDSEHCPQNTTVKENEVLTEEKLPELSCEGHIFKGWWTTIWYSDSEQKEIPVTPGYRIPISGNGDIYLTAKWDKEVTYQKVTFSTEYGTAPEAISVPTGTTLKELAEMLTEDTYIITDEADAWGFIGWEYEGTRSYGSYKKLLTLDDKYLYLYDINEDITLTARWLKKCTVTFETERSVAPEAISGFYGSFTQLAETLSADNYKLTDDEGLRDFLGWKYNGRLLNLEAEENWSGNLWGDITVTAQWQKKKCTITFVTEHGTTPEPVVVDGGTSMDKIYEIYSDEKYKLTAEGYDFLGWSSYNSSDIMYKGDYVICDDIQRDAEWKAKAYTVTFEANEPTKGKNSSTYTLDYDSLIPRWWYSDIRKEGYKLEGWYLDEAFKQKWNFETDVVKGDMTLYAKWIFTIKFNANGGNGTMEDQVFTYGIEEELHKNAFTIDKEHYTFIGWSRSISSLYSYIYGAKIYSDCELISSSISSDGRYSEMICFYEKGESGILF